MKPVDVYEMELDEVEMLWEQITVIEAQEQIKAMKALDFPHQRKQDRQKIHKDLSMSAYPDEMKPKNYVSVETVQRLLGG